MVDAAGPQHRALADDRLGDLGVEQLARGQVAGPGVDRKLLVVEGEGGVGLVGEGHVGLIEGPDRADVLPVVVKQVGLQAVAPLQGGGNDLFAEIGEVGVLAQQVEEGVAAEHIDAHGGQVGPPCRLLRGEAHQGGVHLHGLEGFALGLFAEFANAAVVVGVHQAKGLGLGRIHGQGPDGEVGAGFDVVLDEQAVIHPVELVARQDQVLVHVPFLEQPLVFAHRIGRALKPAGAGGGLLGRQHLNKTLAKTGGEVVTLAEVTVERRAVELRQHVHLVDAGIDAVADRNINQPILARQRHGRLGPRLGEGEKTGPGSAAKDDGQDSFHQRSPPCTVRVWQR